MAENDAAVIIESVQQYWPNFPITQHQLEHPTSEFVIEFYEMFRESMINILSRMTTANDEVISQPHTMNESLFSLLAYVNKYLKKTHPDVDCVVTLTDLYEPNPKRTKIRFKILLSVLSFYESQIYTVRDVIQKRLHQSEEFLKQRREKEILKEALANEAEQLARMEDNIGKLQEELKKTNARYENLELQKANNDRKYTKLQHDFDALAKTYENKETLLVNVKQNIQHLNEQVVPADSYQSMSDLKCNLVKKSEDLDGEIQCFVKNLGEKIPTVERFENINKLKQKLIAKAEELATVQNALSMENAELEKEQEHNQKAMGEIKKLKDRISKTRENMEKMKTENQATVSKLKNEMIQIQKESENLKLKIKKQESSRIKLASDKEELEAKDGMLKNECDQITKDIQELNLLYANAYEKMLRAENEATNHFNDILNNIKKAV